MVDGGTHRIDAQRRLQIGPKFEVCSREPKIAAPSIAVLDGAVDGPPPAQGFGGVTRTPTLQQFANRPRRIERAARREVGLHNGDAETDRGRLFD